MIKIVIYIFIFLFTVWALEGLDLNRLFKQSRIYQARIIYIFIAISITYLVANFIYDFFDSFKIFM